MARIQKLESDSSFQLSQVLKNTVLTYKTYRSGRIIHKAKLANGDVVEINPPPDLSDYYTKAQIDAFISKSLNYKEASQSLTALDRDFLICTDPLTVTLPQVQQGSLIGISSIDTSNYVQILAYAGQGICLDTSNSYQQGMSIGGNCAFVLLYGAKDRWLVADIAANPKGLDNIADQLQNYYDKEQVNSFIEQLSDSISYIKTKLPYFIQFSQVSNNIYTIDSKVTVIGLFTNQGQYYPAQKFSIQYQNNNTKLNVSAYLAYSNQAVFTGTWKALVVAI